MIKFLKDEKGQGLSEYALVIALVAVIAITGLVLLGPVIGDKFSEIACNINSHSVKEATISKEGWYHIDTASNIPTLTPDGTKYFGWIGGKTPTAADKAKCYKVVRI